MWEKDFNSSLLLQGAGLVNDRLYLKDGSHLYALDPSTGDELFKIEAREYYPLAPGEKSIIVNLFDSVAAYDAGDGKKLWEVKDHIAFAPVFPYSRGNSIFVAGTEETPLIYEIDAGSGRIVSRYNYLSQEEYAVIRNYYIDDRIIVYSQEKKDHTLTLFIANYPEEKILSEIETNSLSIDLEVRKKYVLLKGQGSQGYTELVSALSGDLLKSYMMTKKSEIFPGNEDHIIISENNRISVYDITDLTSPEWEYQLKAHMSIRFVYTEKPGHLFVILSDDRTSVIYHFDMNTGKKIKEYKVREVINELIAGEAGTLYLITNTKKVMALN